MSCCEGLRFHCPVLKQAGRDILHILSFSRDTAGLKQESLKRLGIKGPEAPETERECDAHQNKTWQKCHRLLFVSLKSIWSNENKSKFQIKNCYRNLSLKSAWNQLTMFFILLCTTQWWIVLQIKKLVFYQNLTDPSNHLHFHDLINSQRIKSSLSTFFSLISCFTWNYVRLRKKNELWMPFHVDFNGFTPVPISSALTNNKMVLLIKYNIFTCNPNTKSHCHGSEWLVWVSFF